MRDWRHWNDVSLRLIAQLVRLIPSAGPCSASKSRHSVQTPSAVQIRVSLAVSSHPPSAKNFFFFHTPFCSCPLPVRSAGPAGAQGLHATATPRVAAAGGSALRPRRGRVRGLSVVFQSFQHVHQFLPCLGIQHLIIRVSDVC